MLLFLTWQVVTRHRKPSTQESAPPYGAGAEDASWCLRIFLILEAEGLLMLPCTGLSAQVRSAGWPEGSTTIRSSIRSSVRSRRRQRLWRERSPFATGRLSGLLIQAFRELGREHATPERRAHLKRTLPAAERRKLLDDLRLAPTWMHPIFRDLAITRA